MKAPLDTRPTWRGGILQIHITRVCDLACISCTQGSNLGGKPVVMSLENFEIAVKSLVGYPGVVGIFGGNPTMHPKFADICEILRRNIPYEQCGLWSNNLNGYGILCRDTYNPAYSNLNVHSNLDSYREMKRDWPECNPIGLEDSRHSPPYVAMKDMTDLTLPEMNHMIENCDINQLWSAMVCQFRGEPRAFFCEIAGAQSMLHEHDRDYPDTGLYPDSDWWKLPMEAFKQQVRKHCYECGVPLKGFGDLAVNGTKEYVSKTHLPIYQLKKKAGKEVIVVTNTKQLGSKLTRSTDYIQNGHLMKPAKILIAVPTADIARFPQFYMQIDQLINANLDVIVGKTIASGQSPARNRNLMIEQLLENKDFTHILFLDDDISFKPDLVKNLLKHDKEFVTGFYTMRSYPHQPILFKFVDEEGRCTHYFPEDNDRGLVEVVGCGLGAALIKREVFEAMERPWIRLGELDKDHWCDDLGFMRRMRAQGFKLYADLDVAVGHHFQGIVWPNRRDNRWICTYDSRGTDVVNFKSW